MQDAHPTGTTTTTSATGRRGGTLPERRLRRHSHHDAAALKCPRCGSLNTKFCYYNNYNLSQPRHFCKSCRRYWTNGGVLRNVPVGGGSRKSNKRSKPKPEIQANRVELFDRKVALSNSDLKTGRSGFKESSASAGFEELEELGGGIVLDQTVRIDEVLESRGRDGGLVALDWQANDDQSGVGLFDFTSTVDDDQDYWREATTSFDHLHHRQLLQQWSDLSTYNDNNYE